MSRPRRRHRGIWSLKRGLIPLVGRAAAVVALLILLAWGVGRVANDRWYWSQFLWWIPTGLVALVAWSCWTISIIAERLGSRMAGARARPLVLIGAALATAWFVASLRPLNLLKERADGPVRIVYWNAAWSTPTDITEVFEPLDADIIILANPHPGESTREVDAWLVDLERRFRLGSPLQSERSHRARVRKISVVSRWPVALRDEVAIEPPPTAWSRSTLAKLQTGLGYLEINVPTTDEPEETTPLRVVVVDLPSDPLLARRDVIAEAHDMIGDAGWTSPDVVLGDFNTPRGSASLTPLKHDRSETFAAVGAGFGATWPRPIEQLSIDLAFVGNAWRPTRHRTVDTGVGLHRALVIDIAAKPGISPVSEEQPADDADAPLDEPVRP
ncbi:MAG: hypothetical protein CMJ31_03015 [Phycisphaerae bacterium]|nr:hypothetical protein [Phycisphaerae bacterium]